MSATKRQRARRWLVWEMEYAEDGSTVVHARTRRGAALAYMRAAWFTYADGLGVAPLTAGLAKAKRRTS